MEIVEEPAVWEDSEEEATTEEPLWAAPPPPLDLGAAGVGDDDNDNDDDEDGAEAPTPPTEDPTDPIEEFSSEDLVDVVAPADRRIFTADFYRQPRHRHRRHHHDSHRRWHPRVHISAVC